MAAPMVWSVVGGMTALKLLLIPSYKSTDFEVHRNWLAITHNLPIDKWYQEATSEWTLDYPPFFAWFEYLLSFVAKYFDSKMLIIKNLNYTSEMTVLFQRLSVIVTDFIFAYAVRECCITLGPPARKTKTDVWAHHGFILLMILIGNAGLLLVDHIHFQYNGFLFGLLLLSIARILQFRYLEGALWFAVLLNFKHIFLYLAPAYFVYLFTSYCFLSSSRDGIIWKSFSILNFLKLAAVVISVFALSYGPFIYKGQLDNILARLFPFKRGLCHAYWAPNFWALYNITDKLLLILGVKFGLLTKDNSQMAVMTGGLVQEYKHSVLPSISPLCTLICTVISILPALWKLWKQPNRPWEFLRCLILCAFGSFMFGWHVHEKAVLMIIIPMSILAVVNWNDACMFSLLSITGHISLFPLFFTEAETPTKVLLVTLYSFYCYFSLRLLYKEHMWIRDELLILPEMVYVGGLVFLQMYQSIFHDLLGLSRSLPFLPILLFSIYCAIGITYSWVKVYSSMWTTRKPWEKYS